MHFRNVMRVEKFGISQKKGSSYPDLKNSFGLTAKQPRVQEQEAAEMSILGMYSIVTSARRCVS